jgi:hypothetical protein
MIISLALVSQILLSDPPTVDGQGAMYIDGGVSVYGGSFINGSPIVFHHGDMVQFNGWTDSHRDGMYGIGDTSNATFTVAIIGPNKDIVYHNVVKTDETGNAYFTMQIPNDFSFGTYSISYSLEKEGFIGVTPNSSADVNYHTSKFHVTWKEDDIIESDIYSLELSDLQSKSIQYGSSIDIQGTLCPSPNIRTISREALYDHVSGVTVLTEADSPIVVGHFTPIGNISIGHGALGAHNVTALFSQDICKKPFTFSSGVLGYSGNWSITSDAYWMVENDTTHVYHAKTQWGVSLDVAEPLYRSSNILPIRLEDQFQSTIPFDWSHDGKSILFAYYNDSVHRPRLGILDASTLEVTVLDPFSSLPNNVTEWITIDNAKFSRSKDVIIIGAMNIVYRYDVQEDALQKLFDDEPIGFFEVNPDGSILVNRNGTMMITDLEGKNPKVINAPGENPNTGYGDLSPDGKKLLYTKVLDSAYGWSDSVLAYYDLDTKKETIVPNISTGCGYPPKWAPNGFHIMYHEASCSRGWPGAILKITDINGSFEELIVPGSNDYPLLGIFSPDGGSVLIAFSSSGTTGGAAENMGGPANFYIMTLATPMPEFGSSLVAAIVILASVIGLTLKQRIADVLN